jgi:hypothetical protein
MHRNPKDIPSSRPLAIRAISRTRVLLPGSFALRAAMLLLLLALGGLTIGGCLPKKPVAPPVEEMSTAELMERAEAAWGHNRYGQAEYLYLKLVKRPGISRGQEITAWRRAAISAVENRHYTVADKTLQRWASVDASAKEIWTWHRLKAEALLGMGRSEAFERHLRRLVDPEWSWFMSLRAATRLSRHYLEGQRGRDLLALQSELYGLTEDENRKQQAESILLQLLGKADPSAIQGLAREVPEEKRFQFPYCLAVWQETLNRFAAGEMKWRKAWERLAGIMERARLAGTAPLQKILDGLVAEHGRPRVDLALLVPLSGSYADLGQSISRGADIAQWQLTQRGQEARVRLINTASEHWLESLRDLPLSYRLVGGPIRQDVWQAVHRSGQAEERTVFAFRSTLQPGREGKDGYRFFPSTEDQVRPLVEMVQGALEVKRYGVLYPKGEYGRKMAEAFWEELMSTGCELTGLDWYLPGDHTRWKDRVAEFLQVPQELLQDRKDSLEKPGEEKDKEEPVIPDPDFEAVFLPDSFSQARILIPEFFYFNQNDLLFLGPALWSQDVQSISELDQQYYRLALMTGGWWPRNPAPAVDKLKQGLEDTAQGDADFWVALGYDFVRFGHHLAQSLEGTDPERMNPVLADEAGFEWSMAPLKWNGEGKARQDLFVLQPSNRGVHRAHVQRIRHRLTTLRERKKALRNATQRKESDLLNQGAGHEDQPAGSGQNSGPGQTQAH